MAGRGAYGEVPDQDHAPSGEVGSEDGPQAFPGGGRRPGRRGQGQGAQGQVEGEVLALSSPAPPDQANQANPEVRPTARPADQARRAEVVDGPGRSGATTPQAVRLAERDGSATCRATHLAAEGPPPEHGRTRRADAARRSGSATPAGS